MATVIDSLVVQLGFDTKNVKKGEDDANKALKNVKDSAASTAKELESRGTQAGAFFGQIQNKVLGLTAAFLGFSGVKSALTETVSTVAAMGRAAAVTGANIREISAFAQAIERNGGSAAQATQEVEGLIDAVQRWKTLGQASPELQMFYGTIGAGAGTSWLDALKLFADFAQKNKDNPAYVNQIGGFAGLSQTTISELMKGRGAFEADLARSRAIGVATEKDVKAAQELQQSLTGLAQAFDAFTRDIVTKVEPTLKEFVDWLTLQFMKKDVPEAAGAGAAAGFVVGSIIGGPLVGGPAGAAAGAAVGAGAAGVARGYAADIERNQKLGVFVDPETGNIIPLSPSAGSGSGLLDLFRMLERSGDNAVSPAGARGRYQLMPATFAEFAKPGENIDNPADNQAVAGRYLDYLSKRFHGDKDAIAIAYHSGPSAAEKWLAAGRNDAMLGPRTRDYLSRERSYTGGASTTTIQVNGPINVHTQATDAKGIARDLTGSLANQANTGLQ